MFRIDSAKCTGCGTCLDVCPLGAVNLRGDKAEINYRLCTECGMCLDACSVAAIYEVAGVPQGARTYERLAIDRKGREVSKMRGRGWFGWGRPGSGAGFGYGRGFGRGWFGGGWGRGNPYPYCRFYPWLPRRWWATPHAGYHSTAGAPYYTPYRARGWY